MSTAANDKHPIGVFDSGYGGLTVFRSIVDLLTAYDYIYLGDNARAPYGNRSFETVYEYTRECVFWLFEQGCPLVILACNTASAKALRKIQQEDLPNSKYAQHRVLGVVRPTAETIGNYSTTNEIGVLGTSGTVSSQSYPIEIARFFPTLKVYQQSCPLWVPFVENNEYLNDDIDIFIEKDLKLLMHQSEAIDVVLLACTHYPLLAKKIRKYLPAHIQLLSQGDIVAASLKSYLQRHQEMVEKLSQNSQTVFFTTDNPIDFEAHASFFFGATVKASHAIVTA